MTDRMVVRGCDACPLKHESGYGEWCGHPDTTGDMNDNAGPQSTRSWWNLNEGERPAWCPLQHGSLTVELEP